MIDKGIWNVKRNKLNKRKSALCLWLSLVLCAVMAGCELPLTVVGNIPDPENTVSDFFDGVCEGDFKKADACLSGSSIAMKAEPTDIFSYRLMNCLQDSYSYQLTGEMAVGELDAEQDVMFTYLDFDLLSEDLRSECSRIGKKYIKTQDEAHTQTIDGKCTLTDEGAQAVAVEALDGLMAEPYPYYSVATFHIRLRYQGQSWKIIMTDELFQAIAGKYAA